MTARPNESVDKARIRFESWNPYTVRDMEEGARDTPFEAKALLFLPDGERPANGWAGVVIAQGLGGPKPHREIAYGRWLARKGYAALVLDSFGSRGISGIDTWKALRLTTAQMTADAYGALRYLSRHPDIDEDSIAIKGYSFGGMVTMITAYEPIRGLYLPDGEKFAGHIAYYGCSIVRMDNPRTTGAPVLIMIGKKDRNVSVPRTKKIAEDLRKGGSEVELKIFDCYHQWDGDDETRRRVHFNLRHCNVSIDHDGILRDEKSGRTIDGPFSRLLFLARYASLAGYHIKQDKNITERSNEALLEFLSQIQGGETTAANIRQVAR